MNYNSNQVAALLDLYKIAPASSNHAQERAVAYNVFTPADQLEYGILFVNKHMMGVSIDRDLMNAADELYGIDPEAINATFYKNVDTVLGKSRFNLFVEQVIHYMGTYGMASIGEKPITLVPVQELNIPDVDVSKLKVTVIRLVDDVEIANAVNETMTTAKTPSNRVVAGIKALIPFFTAPVDDIRSFELAVIAYDHLGSVPMDPKMFLRYLIYKTTGETLVVNSHRAAQNIKNHAASDTGLACRLLSRANMPDLASIFLRHKNLFLAYKAYDGCKPIINRLRRLADTYHKPMSDVNVKNAIQLVLGGSYTEAKSLIPRMDNRELVKVLNAVSARLNMTDTTPGVFNVRTGRSYCKADAFEPLTSAEFDVLNQYSDWLLYELANRLRPTISGKTFYIPEYVEYTVPTTEKQFMGNFPWGTAFSTECNDFNPSAPTTIGVQWVNPDEEDWVDLDLHCFTADGHHFGWNSDFYGEDGQVIYSGDMTNAPAPTGAAEAFWVKNIRVPIIFTLNEYRGPMNMKFKLALSKETIYGPRDTRDYVMDPNQLLFTPVPLQFNNGTSMTLGFFDRGCFYLYSGNLSEGAVPRGDFSKYIAGIVFQQENRALVSNLLTFCGANVIRSLEEKETLEGEAGVPVVDLSPEKLTASTLLDIVDGKAI